MTTDNIGGVWTYALELAGGLKKSGAEVTLAVIGDPLTANQRKELQEFRYFHFVAKQEWMEDPWDDVQKTGEWLLEIKKKINPDLVHLNSYSLAALQWEVPVVVVLHSCVLTWWKAVKKEEAPSGWNRYRDKISEGIRSADAVAAPGWVMLNSAEKLYGPFKNKKLIYNGRNPQLFKKGKKEKFIFSMGRLWDEAKNIQLVSEAAADIHYNIFVAGDYQTDEFKLKSNIFLLGRMNPDQISDWLSNAAVYVLPAKYEPFGYTFLEAAFSGCALIGGNIDSLKEIWDDAMIYTDTENAQQLARTV
ncbi:MAG: glycosyltransferase family 4 protein, partial [Prolixibacteraceae bacterium]